MFKKIKDQDFLNQTVSKMIVMKLNTKVTKWSQLGGIQITDDYAKIKNKIHTRYGSSFFASTTCLQRVLLPGPLT